MYQIQRIKLISDEENEKEASVFAYPVLFFLLAIFFETTENVSEAHAKLFEMTNKNCKYNSILTFNSARTCKYIIAIYHCKSCDFLNIRNNAANLLYSIMQN